MSYVIQAIGPLFILAASSASTTKSRDVLIYITNTCSMKILRYITDLGTIESCLLV